MKDKNLTVLKKLIQLLRKNKGVITFITKLLIRHFMAYLRGY